MKQYIASLSYGKDSLYMLEVIRRNNLPLNRIVHAQVMATPTISADLPLVTEFKLKADAIILDRYGIKVEHLTAKKSYEEVFYKIQNEGKPDKIQKMYGFPILFAPWCNSRLKMGVLNQFKKHHQYVGYAIDEKMKRRQIKIKEYLDGQSADNKTYPLVDGKITEQECFDWCKANNLLSPAYDTATRDGCWFCHNQPLPTLYELRENHPALWELLLKWDADSDMTFKPRGETVKMLDERFAAGCIYKRDYDKLKRPKQIMIDDLI